MFIKDRIQEMLFWADAIVMHVYIHDSKDLESLKRLLFIANVQNCELGKNKYNSNFKIVITSLKDMDRIFPELKKLFPDDKYLEDNYVHQYKQFFGET